MKPSAKVLTLPVNRRLACSECGAGITAACGCGAPYVPAGKRARDAVAKNPGKSDRAIAADLGLGLGTVQRARKQTEPNGSVAKRIGRDGKARKPPRRPEPVICNPTKEVNAFHSELVKFLTGFSERFTAWHDTAPLLDADGKAALMQALYLCSDGFARLAQKLDGR